MSKGTNYTYLFINTKRREVCKPVVAVFQTKHAIGSGRCKCSVYHTICIGETCKFFLQLKTIISVFVMDDV